MKTVIVIGLGNPILTDDAVGIIAVREASRRFEGRPVVFVEASAGGLDLIDLMSGHAAALLVDAAVTNQARPGEVLDLDPAFLEDTNHLGTTGVAHQVDLATAWKLGRRLGLDLPDRVRIIGVEAADVTTFSEELSPEVAANLPAVVEAVVGAVRELLDGGGRHA
jgi:hydrogenase maturation protease